MELHHQIKCQCGNDIQFFGEIPNNYVCGKCHAKHKGIVKEIKNIKKSEKISKIE